MKLNIPYMDPMGFFCFGENFKKKTTNEGHLLFEGNGFFWGYTSKVFKQNYITMVALCMDVSDV